MADEIIDKPGNGKNGLNPFGPGEIIKVPEMNASMASDQERAIQEVQAAMVIAQKFPRNQKQCMDAILMACTRQGLAEQALYSYQKGGTEVSGSSIRLAETLAQNWRHMQFGIRELSQSNGESVVEAFAWDLQTNVRQIKVFQVPHVRHTRKGKYPLTDPREIYELIANYGARRVRACILGIIPGDVEEAARKQCEKTLNAHADTSPAAMKKMLDKFGELNIDNTAIEDLIGCRVDAIRPAQVVRLRKIYNSIRDGYSKPVDWFGGLDEPAAPDTSKVNESLKAKPAKDKA